MPRQDLELSPKELTFGSYQFAIDKSLQVQLQFFDRGITIGWVGRQALDTDRLDVRWHAGIALQPHREFLVVAGEGVDYIAKIERRRPHQQHVEHSAETKYIRRFGCLLVLTVDLLGSEVIEGPQQGPRTRLFRFRFGFHDQSGQSEISYDRLAAARDQDIGWFQVTMQDVIGMRVCNSVANIGHEPNAFAN